MGQGSESESDGPERKFWAVLVEEFEMYYNYGVILTTYKPPMQNVTRTVSKLFAVLVLVGLSPAIASAHHTDNHNDEASCWISASPSHIYENGSVTLTWGSSDADRAWITDIGDVSLSGSRTVYSIDENTTFKLTVENEQGTASCETRVEVNTHDGHYSGHSAKAPGCTLYRENTWNNGVTLRWNTTDATSAYLSNVGAVSTYGMYTVYPTYNTTYVLTVYGYNGQSRSCELEIDRGYGTYPTYYNQYPQYQYGTGYNYGYPYLSLSQIPYTGFGLGTVGTAVYFLALALFAIAGGYLLSYYNGGVLRFSFAQEVKTAMRNQARSIRNIFSK